MTQESMLDVCRDVIIPFMKESRSKKLVIDCTTVYHNKRIYDLLKENKIKPYPSAGVPFRTPNGYPPNSHDMMPNELINDRLKENARLAFDKLPKRDKTMKRLQHVITKTAAEFPKEFVRNRIRDLPKIMQAVIDCDGGRTKY